MKNKHNAKASALYFFANIFNKGISFLTVPIFTRLLSTYDYGVVTTYSSWASILAAFLGFSLNTAIRYSYQDDDIVNENKKISTNRVLSTIFTFTLLIGLLVTMTAFIVVTFAPINVNVAIVVLCFLHGLFGAIINDYTTFQMMEYKYIGRSLVMILPNLLAAILSVMMILLMRNGSMDNLYMGRIIPLSTMTVLVSLALCVSVYSKYKPCIDRGYLKWALKVSAPLIVHAVALNILSQADRTMITALRDASETGIYSLVYNFSMIATVITTALEGTWTPWFTTKMNEKDYKNVNRVGVDYVNLMTYAMVCLILISAEVLKIFANSAYWEGISIIPPIVCANYIIFVYTIYVNVEYYYEKSGFITINTIISAVTNIVLNFIFIPEFGYIAAAYTTVASYVLSLVLHSMYARKLNKDVFKPTIFMRPLIHILVVSVLYYIFIDVPIMRWTIMIVYLAAMFTRERKRIGSYFPELAGKVGFFR